MKLNDKDRAEIVSNLTTALKNNRAKLHEVRKREAELKRMIDQILDQVVQVYSSNVTRDAIVYSKAVLDKSK